MLNRSTLMKQAVATVGLLVFSSTLAIAGVRLELRTLTPSVCTGEEVQVGLYAVATGASDHGMSAIEAIILWDESALELIGFDDPCSNPIPPPCPDPNTYDWFAVLFPDDRAIDRLNADLGNDLFWSEVECTLDTDCWSGSTCDPLPCSTDNGCRAGVPCDETQTCYDAGQGNINCCETTFCYSSGMPFNDGDAKWEAWVGFPPPGGVAEAVATTEGLWITGFRFLAIGSADTTVGLLPSTPSGMSSTAAYASATSGNPGEDITSSIGAPVNVAIGNVDPPDVVRLGCRALRITPQPGGTPLAIYIQGDPANADVACIGKYVDININDVAILTDTPAFRTPAEWGVIEVAGAPFIPSSVYHVYGDCGSGPTGAYTAASTCTFGDVDCNGFPDIDDVLLILACFGGDCIFPLEANDIVPCAPDRFADIDDVLASLAAFGGTLYSDFCPPPCP